MSITCQKDAKVFHILLNQSSKGNRLNPETLLSFYEAIKSAEQDSEIRCVLIKSDGPTFCEGMDLVRYDESSSELGMKSSVELYAQVLNALYSSPLPIICVIKGSVKAGGVGLVCACDIVIGTTETSFELSEVILGLIPANVLPYLMSLRISPQKARYLCLTSKRVLADEAHALGLLDEKVLSENLDSEIKKTIKGLLRSSPAALSEVKSFTGKILYKTPSSAAPLAIEKILELSQDESTKAAIAAFNQGSTPSWFEKYKPQVSLTQ